MATPFLKPAWYVIGWSDEITATPIRRRFLNEAVVVYRGEDGVPAALADACAHRFVPLSQGRVVGGVIQCAYHGLQFDARGACLFNPHGDGRIPPAAQVRSYALAERQGMVWIWGGARETARYEDVPRFAFLDDPCYAIVRGCMVVEANYQLVTDNLMDLSHVDYLHPLLRTTDRAGNIRHEVKRDGDRVRALLWRDGVRPSGLQQLLWNDADTGNARAHMHWMMPSILELDTGITAPDAAIEQGVCLPSLHLLTPETEARTRYFWLNGRNRRIADEALSEQVRGLIDQAFTTEDKPVIEAQQRYIGATDIMDLKPALLQPDAAAVHVRRIMKRALAAQDGPALPD